VPRAVSLTATATWWPSTLYQTSTLELRAGGERLLVDPGISPWEIQEVVDAHDDPVTQVLLTHADWDHVLGVPMLPDATVTASRSAASRIASGEASASVVEETRLSYVEYGDMALLRVDRSIDPPSEQAMGPWHATFRPGRGHTDDGLITSLPEQGLVIAGDYLSALEIPAAYASVVDYRDTLHTLIAVIEREQPRFVVVGHGAPAGAAAALRIADEDLDYIDAVLAFAEAGCDPDHAARIAVPDRGGGPFDRESHERNVRLACAAMAAV
jgi:hydroxyacylglutathione hydrolase